MIIRNTISIWAWLQDSYSICSTAVEINVEQIKLRVHDERLITMKKKMEYLLLAFAGASLLLMTAYIQLTLMDFDKHGIEKYVVADLDGWPWWPMVGIPFLLGSIYLGVAVFGFRANLVYREALLFFGCCFFLGCVLLIVSPFGYFAVITTGLCLTSVAFGKSR